MPKGADYAWATVNPSSLKAAGVTFVVRYVSRDLSKLSLPEVAAVDAIGVKVSERSRRAFTAATGSPRAATYSEVSGLLGAGIGVAVVWEDTANAAAQGYARGVSDATEADRQVRNLGLAGVPVYFAADYDAPAGDQAQINAYLDGAASVLGRARVGLYGGYWVVSRARAAGKASYYWGTYAWSGSNWGSCGWTPHLMQQLAMVSIAGVQCDIDIASTADFGQYQGADPYPALIAGATGPAVVSMQTRINVWGAARPPVALDGVFGDATLAGLRQFQKISGLPVDGICGLPTWKALNQTPPAPGQLPAPTSLGVDRKRVPVQWNPVPGAAVTGYQCVAYGADGKEYARASTSRDVTWCVLDGLAPGGTYTIEVWADGGPVAPLGARFTVTLPA